MPRAPPRHATPRASPSQDSEVKPGAREVNRLCRNPAVLRGRVRGGVSHVAQGRGWARGRGARSRVAGIRVVSSCRVEEKEEQRGVKTENSSGSACRLGNDTVQRVCSVYLWGRTECDVSLWWQGALWGGVLCAAIRPSSPCGGRGDATHVLHRVRPAVGKSDIGLLFARLPPEPNRGGALQIQM